MARRPLVVYVGCAPGSGKTTLAQKIAQELYIPHISSDRVHGGVRFTEGKPNNRKASLHDDVFVPLLEVDAIDGYNPGFDRIIAFIEKVYEERNT
jgi:2-phosphoglycerate kinase